MTVERIQKILSNAGVASRRVAEELILAGRVAINGEVQHTLGARADLDSDEVTVDGVPVVREKYRYFLLNKPSGFITTVRDEMDRETVLDLVPIGDIQLHPVGRLDRESEGLLILTNDGHLTDLLTHPKYEVEKEYLVGIDSMPSQHDMERLVRGVESEGERLRASAARAAMAPAAAPGEDVQGAAWWLVITLKEGRNREIRRMVEALGRQVLLLRRIRLGPLLLGDLGSGSFRELTPGEVDQLYAAGKRAEGLSEPAPQASKFVTKNTSSASPPAGPKPRPTTVGTGAPAPRTSRFAGRKPAAPPKPAAKPKPTAGVRKPGGPRQGSR